MMKKALRKNTLIEANNLRYYVYDPKSRLRIGDPTPQAPPKHIFEYKYQFGVYPDQYQGFVYWKRDRYVAHHMFAFENYSFKYPGEQWHIGSLFWNFVYFTFPLTFFLLRYYENEVAKAQKGVSSQGYFQQGGMATSDHLFRNPSTSNIY